MSTALYLKHVLRLWRNIWCCEVDPLFCGGVALLEAVKAQSGVALHESLLRAGSLSQVCPRCCFSIRSSSRRQHEDDSRWSFTKLGVVMLPSGESFCSNDVLVTMVLAFFVWYFCKQYLITSNYWNK